MNYLVFRNKRDIPLKTIIITLFSLTSACNRYSQHKDAFSLCEGVTKADTSNPITLTRLQFYRSFEDSFDFEAFFLGEKKSDYLIGCLTNQTQEDIGVVRLGIEYVEEESIGDAPIQFPGTVAQPGQQEGGIGTAPALFPGTVVKPDQTVPFRYGLDIAPEITEIRISNVLLFGSDVAQDDEIEVIADFDPQIIVPHRPEQTQILSIPNQSCEGIEPFQPNQPVEIQALQIYPFDQDPFAFEPSLRDDAALIGCLTNHTDQPLNDVHLVSVDDEGLAGAKLMYFAEESIQPQQTVAVVNSGLLTDTKFLHIQTISYTNDQGFSEEIEVDIKVNR
ncbi:MAG: hypothetical protein AAGG51_03900 [Cyanobacteria bacterium P01_G01_bin.54]